MPEGKNPIVSVPVPSDAVFDKLVPPRNVLFVAYGAYNGGDFDYDDVDDYPNAHFDKDD